MPDLTPTLIGTALDRRILFAGSPHDSEHEVGFVHDQRGRVTVTLFDDSGEAVDERTFQIVEVIP